jgi:hypothetical protein
MPQVHYYVQKIPPVEPESRPHPHKLIFFLGSTSILSPHNNIIHSKTPILSLLSGAVDLKTKLMEILNGGYSVSRFVLFKHSPTNTNFVTG